MSRPTVFFLRAFAAAIILSMHCSLKYTIQEDDRIAFLGGTNTLMGYISANGFARVFENEIRMLLPNVTFFGGGIRAASLWDIASHIDRGYLDPFRPTMAIVLVDVDEFSHLHHTKANLNDLQLDLERLIAKLQAKEIRVVICTTTMHGEKPNGENEKDDMLVEFSWITRAVAKEYNTMQVDLLGPLMRHVDHINFEGSSRSSAVLTYDGRVLNEVGHAVVAQTLLKSFGIPSHDYFRNNAAVKEARRVAEIKKEMETPAAVQLTAGVRTDGAGAPSSARSSSRGSSSSSSSRSEEL